MSVMLLILLLLGAGVAAWVSERVNTTLPNWIALITFVAATLWVLVIWFNGPNVDGLYAYLERPWIPRFGIDLQLRVDALSLMLIGLTTFLGIVAVVSSWTETKTRHGFFQFNILWVMAGVVGVFSAFDLFLFFFFWEVMLIPMYFLIAIWGHEDKENASMKFFLFTQISGLLMLVAIVALVWINYNISGVLTFDYDDVERSKS